MDKLNSPAKAGNSISSATASKSPAPPPTRWKSPVAFGFISQRRRGSPARPAVLAPFVPNPLACIRLVEQLGRRSSGWLAAGFRSSWRWKTSRPRPRRPPLPRG